MKTRIYTTSFLIFLSTQLAGCNEPVNPLIGQWQEASPTTASTGHTIEFTPSTMRLNGQTVTVVYQMRDNKVRVSASKNAIIYEFDDADSIHYEDKNNGTINLIRVKP